MTSRGTRDALRMTAAGALAILLQTTSGSAATAQIDTSPPAGKCTDENGGLALRCARIAAT